MWNETGKKMNHLMLFSVLSNRIERPWRLNFLKRLVDDLERVVHLVTFYPEQIPQGTATDQFKTILTLFTLLKCTQGCEKHTQSPGIDWIVLEWVFTRSLK